MPVVIPPSGLSPAGLFVPETYPAQGRAPGILADAIDPATGDYASIRLGMHPIDQQVIAALSIVRRSGAAVHDDGHELNEIKVVDDAVNQRIDSAVRRALKRLADAKDIRIDSLQPVTSQDSSAGYALVRYVNLRASGDRSRRIGVTR